MRTVQPNPRARGTTGRKSLETRGRPRDGPHQLRPNFPPRQPGRRPRRTRRPAQIEFRGRRVTVLARSGDGVGNGRPEPVARRKKCKRPKNQRRTTTRGRGRPTGGRGMWKLNYLKRFGGIAGRLKTVVRRVTHTGHARPGSESNFVFRFRAARTVIIVVVRSARIRVRIVFAVPVGGYPSGPTNTRGRLARPERPLLLFPCVVLLFLVRSRPNPISLVLVRYAVPARGTRRKVSDKRPRRQERNGLNKT